MAESSVHLTSVIVTEPALQFVDRAVLDNFFKKMLWKLYDQHENDVIFKFKKFFISITVRVKDIRLLIEKFAGPHP